MRLLVALVFVGTGLLPVLLDCGGLQSGTIPEGGSSDEGSAGSGGSLGSGGATGAGGTVGSGGSVGSGGNVGSGGAAGFGGSAGVGGSAGLGGSGGSLGTGVGDSAIEASFDSSPLDSGPVDASGLFTPACTMCLKTACKPQLSACTGRPACLKVLECIRACVADGGMSTDACGLSCAATASAAVQGEVLALSNCANKSCPGPCGPDGG